MKKFTLEDRDSEWYHCRAHIARNKEKSMTKSFRITTRRFQPNSEFRVLP